MLLKVIESIDPGALAPKKWKPKPKNRYEKMENANYVVELGGDLNFSLTNIGGIDILDGNKKIILAYTWQLMRHHMLSILSSLQLDDEHAASEEDIIEWANNKVMEADSSESMASFKDSSLGDSMFLMDLLSAINRGCVNWEMVKGVETDEDRMYNAKYVISVARKLGCAVFLTWEDIVKVRPLFVFKLVTTHVPLICYLMVL